MIECVDDGMAYCKLYLLSENEIEEVAQSQKQSIQQNQYIFGYQLSEERKQQFEMIEIPKEKQNMCIIGHIDGDIGTYLNKVVMNGLEKDVMDYMYPDRNKQIVLEIMGRRGRLTNNKSWTHHRLSKRDRLILESEDLNGENNAKFEMKLPIDNKEITHWYPCIGLRDAGDTCEISGICVKESP